MTKQPNPRVGTTPRVGRAQAVRPLMTETEVARLCGVHVQPCAVGVARGSDHHGCAKVARSSTTPSPHGTGGTAAADHNGGCGHRSTMPNGQTPRPPAPALQGCAGPSDGGCTA